MAENIENCNNKNFELKPNHTSEKEDSVKGHLKAGKVIQSMYNNGSGSLEQGFPIVQRAEDVSSSPYPDALELVNHVNYVMGEGDSESESEVSELIIDRRSSSLERAILDHESLLEYKTTSPIQESSDILRAAGKSALREEGSTTVINGSGGSRSPSQDDFQVGEQEYTDTSEENDLITSDDDSGGDYTVSKYHESKIFGVWMVAGTVNDKVSPSPGAEVVVNQNVGNQVLGISEIPGSSHSRIPPLKLTLKKSSLGTTPEEQQPRKEKLPKMKNLPKKEKLPKVMRSPSKPKRPYKSRKVGRPLTSKPTKLSTRQRLMNLFRKGKGKKRGPRTESVTCSMPPTIRSIAKS